MNTPRCPLCRGERADLFFEDQRRRYLRCRHCRLVFVPRCYRPGPEVEKAVYDLHQNDAGDPGYRRFLSRLARPLAKRLKPGQKGLDFGCGPGPTLSVLLEEQGHEVDLYDPFYCNDPSVFDRTYDFICATEVVEHLHAPGREFEALFRMLAPNGWLGMMTKLVIDRHAFAKWHYIRDVTHVCFYSRATFAYLARRFDARLHMIADDVILLRKAAGDTA
ncbi:2-polyprenyl-3-methyl-5-hydroxy-6-metoxy-1,4-benz oquinol methylase [Desulfosarcina alkanivorans]|uniref:2-polyprenyl-3-methyl-5-hydroxy-6-metoxy-1,4-benz oquinol methylase n=1 Tax=Desulfosarcina alkanivorans TaxID=571177 RepID=A0A5K7YBD8_9BACT|nr:2-polyprenyl-3-methyl-5-hydroxy-6-metoxy-1,4-benz oquinol methylase [Desulfosarcina alkanivorans]